MALGQPEIDVLIRLRIAGFLPARSRVIEIGAQQLANDFLRAAERITRLGELFDIGISPAFAAPDRIVVPGEPLDAAAPLARDFWLWLGFEYAAIDIDGSPESIPLDLNYDDAPPEAKGRYDLVTNFGTTEHIVNQLNAFKVIHELTAPGGIMLHTVPAQGYANHGLVNYNFKFFWMLARSNGYKFLDASLHGAHIGYPLPGDIADFLTLHDPDPEGADRARILPVPDAAIQVAMQKSFDIPFVPPLDVATGATTDLEALRRRYWTVFEPDAFAALAAFPRSRSGR